MLGQIVREEWLRSGEIRQEIRLFDDEFMVMPNHGHGIIWIMDTVGADGVRPNMREGAALGAFMAGFKASVSSRARHELDMTGIWQRNDYEYIIRSDREWNNIR